MDAVLKEYYGYSSLRDCQREIIGKILEGRDCLVVMATGSGKSICYQIPALVTNKTAIVVSPLLSLMQDQVMGLKQKGIRSDYLGSSQKNTSVIRDAEQGKFAVLYMTPEKAVALPSSFWSNLLAKGVSLFAVDEAHCISEWGHDFRIEFKKLHRLRKFLVGVPFAALTATATQRVRSDIISSLDLHDPHIYIGTFDRPNLFYGVSICDRSQSFIKQLVKDVWERSTCGQSTIIYCSTVRDTEQIHSALITRGIRAGIYHGKMNTADRENSHRSFVNDETLVMVATIAFGMGIDKPDVRCVIHYGCPKSLESYYQESGRCGRDGLPSVCWLYYSRSDFTKGEFYCGVTKDEQQKEAIMRSYAAGKTYCRIDTCRRQNLLKYFGEDIGPKCGNCDNCNSAPKKQRDMKSETLLLLSAIKMCGERWGLIVPINVLRGSHAKKIVANNLHLLDIHGAGKNHTLDWWKAFGDVLINHGFIEETMRGTYRFISVTDKGCRLLDGNDDTMSTLFFQISPDMASQEDEDDSISDDDQYDNDIASDIAFSNGEKSLYDMLLNVRLKLAKDNSAAPYAICGDQVLRWFAKMRPSTEETMALVDGVNLNFLRRYSVVFIHCIKEMSFELNLCLDAMDIDVEDTEFDGLDYDETISIESMDYEESGDGSKNTQHQLPQYDTASNEWTAAVLEIVSSSNGISLKDLLANFNDEDEEMVIKAIDDLEVSFEIYNKNGNYFPL